MTDEPWREKRFGKILGHRLEIGPIALDVWKDGEWRWRCMYAGIADQPLKARDMDEAKRGSIAELRYRLSWMLRSLPFDQTADHWQRFGVVDVDGGALRIDAPRCSGDDGVIITGVDDGAYAVEVLLDQYGRPESARVRFVRVGFDEKG